MENGKSACLSILNVTGGDFKLTFDQTSPGEAERAAAVVTDMLKRGYVIVVSLGDGKYRRVRKFNAKTFEYIVRDLPKAHDTPMSDTAFPAQTTPAVAIARTARGCAREWL